MSENNRTRSISFSSEHPYERWFGTEILDHKPSSIRMGFMRSGRAPLLMGHDQRAVIGIVESATIDSKTKMGRAEVRFSRSDFASDKLRDVDDGILVNVSTGYRVHEMVLEKQSDAGDTYRVTDWEPLEASLVGIPADPTVGVDRSAAPINAVREVQIAEPQARAPVTPSTEQVPTPAVPAIRKESTMDKDENAAAGENAGKKITAIEAEKERREAIGHLCKSNKIDGRVEARWIEEGTPLNQVARELVDVMEERGKARPALAAELGLSASDTKKYSLFRAIRALKFGAGNPRLMEDAAFEIECSRAVAKQLGRDLTSSILIPAEVLTKSLPADVMARAMATTQGATGGYLVGVENMGFIDILRNRSVAMRMGARRLSGLVGNVTFGRQTGKATVTWQGGEGVSITASDQALGQLSMTPKTAIAITDVSEQLLRQSSPSAEAFVLADLAADIAIDGVDNVAINGTGGAQPIGIKNTAGITSGQSASTFSYAKALAFPVAAGAVNAIRGNPGWVTNIAGASIAMQRQRFTSTDSPLWEGNLLDGTLVGFKAMSSEQLASANIIFGSWDELVIGEWGVLELAMDNGGTRFNQAQVGIRAMYMVDVMLRYPQAFVVGTDLS
jgi:HK97 family phage major capsid protein